MNQALYIASYFKEGEVPRVFYGEADKEFSLALFVVELEYNEKWKEEGFNRRNYGCLAIYPEEVLYSITNKPDVRMDLNEDFLNEETNEFLDFVLNELAGDSIENFVS